MALSLCFYPLTSYPKPRPMIPFNKPINIIISSRPKLSKQCLLSVNCVQENSHKLPVAVSPAKSRREEWLSTAASLYPVYVTVGGVVACLRPSIFSWFINAGPTSYTLALGFIMLAMGLTLQLKDLFNLFLQRPLSKSEPLTMLQAPNSKETKRWNSPAPSICTHVYGVVVNEVGGEP